MKRILASAVLGITMMFAAPKTQAYTVTRSMFPTWEMAQEMADTWDRELNLTNRQYDEICYYYFDWIEDVLDWMEYDRIFPMRTVDYDYYVQHGFRFFYDSDSFFRARKKFFSAILTRSQYNRWLRIEENARRSVNGFTYIYGFPRLSYYNYEIHRYYIYIPVPHPVGHYRYGYCPGPRIPPKNHNHCYNHQYPCPEKPKQDPKPYNPPTNNQNTGGSSHPTTGNTPDVRPGNQPGGNGGGQPSNPGGNNGGNQGNPGGNGGNNGNQGNQGGNNGNNGNNGNGNVVSRHPVPTPGDNNGNSGNNGNGNGN
ncbi:MAG: hypothetical protein HUJ98_12485, partial [Bacteroidaceae bacterium]|nr:hypothetical protein [Bacteroidaceae bacterium]